MDAAVSRTGAFHFPEQESSECVEHYDRIDMRIRGIREEKRKWKEE